MIESSVRYLLHQFFRNQCTPEEKVELARWINESAHDETLRKILEDAWKDYEPVETMSGFKAESILSGIFKEDTKAGEPIAPEAPVRHIWWKRLSVAAVFILLMGTGSYLLFFSNQKQEMVAGSPGQVTNDALPGTQKATLTLSDGSRIYLHKDSSAKLAKQGNTNITIDKGALVYESQAQFHTVLYNTLSTARGELYPLNLADGSRVWLNSASSIRFPVAFYGTERIVEVTGEAYFEVAKNINQPFKVNLNGMCIEVLGTHFNVNAYADESVIRTTLLEGSVKIFGTNASILLLPGQQAGLVKSGKFELIKEGDTEEAVSWKDGYFHFKNADLQTVMRQLSRWYNVDVEYESKGPPQYFGGDIEKSLQLSRVLKILEKSQVHAKISGKKLIVLK